MKTLRLVGLLILAALASCDLNGSSDPGSTVPPPSPEPPPPGVVTVHFEGIWQGAMTSGEPVNGSAAIALVNGWGEFRLVSDGVQFVGFPQRTVTGISGLLTGIRSAGTTWSDGERISDFDLSGSISSDGFIDATFEGSADSGILWMNQVAVAGPTDIAALNATWGLYDENQNMVATFLITSYSESGARISGAHANGCTYTGTSESWTSFYSYNISALEVAGCPLVDGSDPNGAYVGTAGLVDVDDDDSDEPVLVVALSSDTNQLTFFLHRLSP